MNERKKLRPTDNDIPDEVLQEAGMFARAFMKLPPMNRRELKEKLERGKKN